MPTLTVLVNDEPAPPPLVSEHGQALWLDLGSARVLVDAGQTRAALDNAGALGIDLATATHLVLTHGHYDHTGGVPALLETGARPTILAGRDAWDARRARHDDGGSHPVGIPWPRELLRRATLVETTAAVTVAPGVRVVSPIPASCGLPDASRLERLTSDGWRRDDFREEQAVVLATAAGLVVITGCCHRGVVNTLLAAQLAAGCAQIYALVGGLHLHQTDDADVRALARALQPFNIRHLWVNHCAGPRAAAVLREELGDTVRWAGTGFRADLSPVLVDPRAPSEAGPARIAEFPGCYVCGEHNPGGLRLPYRTADDGTITAVWQPEAPHQGFVGLVHGGLVATVLDEAMAKAVVALGVQAPTCELRVRLRRAVTPHTPLAIRGWITSHRGRRLTAEGTLTGPDGAELAHAWGTFLALPKTRAPATSAGRGRQPVPPGAEKGEK